MTKRSWEKPELIVLTRSQPEERVLAACKCDTTPVGMYSENNNCYDSKSCDLTCDSLTPS